MSLPARTWTGHDQVAIRDRVDQPWTLGTVTGIRPAGWLAIRVDGGETVDIRHPDDVRVIPAAEVPVDERHWLPETVRDQLVRQEAVERLWAFARIAAPCAADSLDVADIVDELDDVVRLDPELTRAARALLAPAPQPATTPTTEGLPA